MSFLVSWGCSTFLALGMISCTSPSLLNDRTSAGDTIWSSNWVDASDWSDGGLWQRETGSTDHLRVESGDPNAPTSDYLSVYVYPLGSTGSSAAVACPVIKPDPPAVGETITWRWYAMFPDPSRVAQQDAQFHPSGMTGTLSPPLVATHQWYMLPDDRVNVVLNVGAFYSTTSGTPGSSSIIDNSWHRYEFSMIRLSEARLALRYAVYEHPSGDLVVNTGDFVFTPNRLGDSRLEDVVVDLGSAAVLEDAVTDWCGFANGLAGSFPQDYEYMRWAAVAAVIGDSVGPYPISGEN